MFNWFKKKLMPARTQYTGDNLVVADLDKMIVEPVPFRWNGRVHFIKPITVAENLRVTENLARLDLMKNKKEIGIEELIDGYAELIGIVCDSIGKKEIREMTQPQVGALFQLVLDSITGRVHGDQKKNPTLAQAQPQTTPA